LNHKSLFLKTVPEPKRPPEAIKEFFPLERFVKKDCSPMEGENLEPNASEAGKQNHRGGEIEKPVECTGRVAI